MSQSRCTASSRCGTLNADGPRSRQREATRGKAPSQLTSTPSGDRVLVAAVPQSEALREDASRLLCPLCLRCPVSDPVILHHSAVPCSAGAVCLACHDCAASWRALLVNSFGAGLKRAAGEAETTSPSRTVQYPCPQCGARIELPDPLKRFDGPTATEVTESHKSSARSSTPQGTPPAVLAVRVRNCKFRSSQVLAPVEDQGPVSPATLPCGVCEANAGTAFCVQCDFPLCDDCQAASHGLGRFKVHQLLRIGPGEATAAGADQAASVAMQHLGPTPRWPSEWCPHHLGSRLDLYCATCHECVCAHCCFGSRASHMTHSVAPLTEAVESTKCRAGALAVEVAAVEGIAAQVVHSLHVVYPQRVSDSAAEASATVTKFFDGLRAALQQREAALVAEIDAAAKASEDALRRVAQRLSAVANAMKMTRAAAITLAESVSDSDYMRAHHIVIRQLQAVSRYYRDCFGCCVPSGMEAVAPQDESAVAARIVARCVPKSGFSFSPGLHLLEQQMAHSGQIRPVAQYGGDLLQSLLGSVGVVTVPEPPPARWPPMDRGTSPSPCRSVPLTVGNQPEVPPRSLQSRVAECDSPLATAFIESPPCSRSPKGGSPVCVHRTPERLKELPANCTVGRAELCKLDATRAGASDRNVPTTKRLQIEALPPSAVERAIPSTYQRGSHQTRLQRRVLSVSCSDGGASDCRKRKHYQLDWNHGDRGPDPVRSAPTVEHRREQPQRASRDVHNRAVSRSESVPLVLEHNTLYTDAAAPSQEQLSATPLRPYVEVSSLGSRTTAAPPTPPVVDWRQRRTVDSNSVPSPSAGRPRERAAAKSLLQLQCLL